MNALLMPDSTLQACPEEALHEVVNGRTVELPSMGVFSSMIANKLYLRLGLFVEQHRLGWTAGEVLFILDPVANLRRRPDVAFVSAERWPLDRPLPETGDWPIVPDLAVEVVSPNDLFEAVHGKIDEYFAHGVRQVWLFDPPLKRCHVYEAPTQVRILTEADALAETVVPGFTLKLAELFATPGL